MAGTGGILLLFLVVIFSSSDPAYHTEGFVTTHRRHCSSRGTHGGGNSSREHSRERSSNRRRGGGGGGAVLLFNNNNQNNNNYNNNQKGFDMTRPTFDLYSLRTIRGDALLRYNNLNQSEPLRINLYLIALFTSFSYPLLSEAVVNAPASTVGVVVSSLVGSLATYRFVRECTRRATKLAKLEKECTAQTLPLKLPSNYVKVNPFVERLFMTQPVPLGQVLQDRGGGRRILALYGSQPSLRRALVDAQLFRRRLQQANVLIVPIPNDLHDTTQKKINSNNNNIVQYYTEALHLNPDLLKAVPFIAEVAEIPTWVEYFESLLVDNDNTRNDETTNTNNNKDEEDDLIWFGLSSSGKSFGSGKGLASLRWLELLGQSLVPVQQLFDLAPPSSLSSASSVSATATTIPAAATATAATKRSTTTNTKGGSAIDVDRETARVLLAQQQFYQALTDGSREAMDHIMATTLSAQVTEVVQQGGSIDAWDLCLREGARPDQLQISDPDIFFVHHDETEQEQEQQQQHTTIRAYTTNIEFPLPDQDLSASLLAVQSWVRVPTYHNEETDTTTTTTTTNNSDEEYEWKLQLHQTIPWGTDTRAGATLRCDGRGCTALAQQQPTAQNQQYNWRGMID